MGLFSGWLKKIDALHNPDERRQTKSGSLESRQTGSCGGMSTTELKIRMELELGNLSAATDFPLMEYANKLASFSHSLQSRVLQELAEFSDFSPDLAREFLSCCTTALADMELTQYEKWIFDIKHSLTDNDLQTASNLIKDYKSYSEGNHNNIVYLSNIILTIEKLILSIHENEIPVLQHKEQDKFLAYTDGHQFYLPNDISLFDEFDDNYLLYKVLTFQLLGQLHCQTWSALPTITEYSKKYGPLFLEQFSKIETLRIDQHIKHEFPGIWRSIQKLNEKEANDYPYEYIDQNNCLHVNDSINLTIQSLNSPNDLIKLAYQSHFFPDKISREAIQRRQIYFIEASNPADLEEDLSENLTTAERIIMRNQNIDTVDPLESSAYQQTPAELNGDLADSTNSFEFEELSQRRKSDEDNIFYYKEWDTSLNKYRKDWCCIEELPIELEPDKVSEEPDKSIHYIEHRMRRMLDFLINDQKSMRYQKDGDEIDIDAWISSYCNKKNQQNDEDNLYIRNNKNNRSVAIMFAVDISSSTSGWKNNIIRQSTWLLSKALSRLDDQYAIYAFSGSGRNQCRIYPMKEFNETYSKTVKQRILSIQPQQYTRMGAAIRHLTYRLSLSSAKTKILFILTDGKPDDIDSYRGNYGVEDTRRALCEARASAYNPFVLTFDKEAKDYLPHMLGSNRFQLISDISELPIQISNIYRQLTT